MTSLSARRPDQSSRRPSRRRVLAALAAPAILAALPIRVSAAPGSKLIDPRWQTTGAGGDPDYAPWAAFLGAWLRPGGDGITRVDYRGALAAGARAPLTAFVAETQKVDPTTLSSAAAMAWWINLYNAATIDLVLSEYPVRTILKIKGGLFNSGPWDEKILTVNGAALSLNDVEHGILRPIWADPRVHYAVNCASIGCPNLDGQPWRADDLDTRMTMAARAYVNHPRGARVEAGSLTVSKIYDWFEEDFGGSSAGVISHLRTYADDDLAAKLTRVSRVSNSEYDWALNDA